MSVSRWPAPDPGADGADGAHGAAGSAAGDTDVAAVAALIGDPARARMLLALCAGDALSASALAGEARLSAPATSAHLTKLRAARLITVTRVGRHRYYRIAGRDVVDAMETLARLAPAQPVRSLRQDGRARALHFARVCYDHLAGTLAVRIAEALVERGAMAAAEPDVLGDVTWSVGDRAAEVFGRLGVPADLVAGHVPLYPCLDWSVRRPHLSGAVGSAMLTTMLGTGWVERVPEQRAVRLTGTGRSGLRDLLGIRIETGVDYTTGSPVATSSGNGGRPTPVSR